jgi:hypothetical protein
MTKLDEKKIDVPRQWRMRSERGKVRSVDPVEG